MENVIRTWVKAFTSPIWAQFLPHFHLFAQYRKEVSLRQFWEKRFVR